jgi:hypothetical protein
LKISDFLTLRKFHSSGLYADFYRRVGVEQQMAFILPAAQPLIIGIALNRSRSDFSERDRLLLNLVRPHLIQAYRNADSVTQMSRQSRLALQGLTQLNRATIFLTKQGRVRPADCAAIDAVPGGLFLTRVEHAQYRWNAQKPYYAVVFSVWNEHETRGCLLKASNRPRA